MNTLDILLKADIPNMPEQEVKLKRLSSICGAPVIFKLKALPYSRAAELSKNQSEELNVHIVLAGTVEPNLKDAELLSKYNAVTPAELVKNMLLPGEIEDISRTIEKLSGYRTITIEELKKK
ncbi:MAG: Phage XkdN-like protein [Herbinix sp.]|jgi:hypothetical protein|nr:Phage XkdN-like protein [Herbinix sp.]